MPSQKTIPRREFIKGVGAIALSANALTFFDPQIIHEIQNESKMRDLLSPKRVASDEVYWEKVRSAFAPSKDFINLENGYYSPQTISSIETQYQKIQYVNALSSSFMRNEFGEARATVKKQLAELAGCSVDEIVITRNTTESLDTIISGLHLQAGDECIQTNQDYGSMRAAFVQQGRRFGVVNKIISLPLHPKNDEEIVAAFEQAITSKTKVMLVTHMINLTGQILPVRKICDMAHAHNVEVIVDAAHSFAHIDFAVPDLHCDYFGTSLHKWLCAPLGLGMLYVRKEKIKNVWPLFGDTDYPEDDIRKFEHLGTQPVATLLTLPNAIAFHQSIGTKRKEERLRYLKNYWVNRVREEKRLHVLCPSDDARSCAITTVGIDGKLPKEVSDYLWKGNKIFTVAIDSEAVKGVRITPHLFTTLNELDLLVTALKEFCAS